MYHSFMQLLAELSHVFSTMEFVALMLTNSLPESQHLRPVDTATRLTSSREEMWVLILLARC